MADLEVTDLGIWQNGKQTTNPFFIFEKVWFRLETTEPVVEFYIDWDDGDDNSPDKANIEHIILEEPAFFCVSSHVYTRHGSFYPLVRVKGADGYLSKWYTAYEDEGSHRTTLDGTPTDIDTTITVDNAAANGGIADGDTIRINEEYMYVSNVAVNDLTVVRKSINGTDFVGEGQEHADGSLVWKATGSNQNDFSGLEPETLEAGQNEFSSVSIDNIMDHRLPVYRPANKPPIAVLKTDRNRIYSGINNELLGAGNTTVYIDGSDSNTTTDEEPRIKVIYIDGNTNKSQILETTTYHGQSILNVDKILRVEIINLKEATSATSQSLQGGERIYLKMTGAGGFAICNVSLGQPIIESSNSQNIATLDLSESRTRASNVSISEYYIDDGHQTTGSSRWEKATDPLWYDSTSAATRQVSPTMHPEFRVYYPSIETQHTFQPELDPLGTDGRYLSREIFCRGQVKDSSADTRVDSGTYISPVTGDTIESSFLEHTSSSYYRNSTTGGTTKPWPESLKSSHILTRAVRRLLPVWSDMNTIQSSMQTDKFILGGGHDTTPFGATTQVIPGGTDYKVEAENYLFMTNQNKFDRIFFKTINAYTAHTAPTLDRSTIDNSTVPPYRISIFYPSKNEAGVVIWKPLTFKDTTAYESVEASSFMRDGSISFRPPKDWEKTHHGNVSVWPFGTSFDVDNDGTDGPVDLWTEAKVGSEGTYGLLICMATDGEMAADTEKNIGISFMFPYTNSHTQVLTMVDNTHVSLNDKYITQSISFVRSGIYNIITNKLGKAEIRKIGAQSGSIKFGGTDLSGDTSRKDFKIYQQNGTPVYLDVEHKNGDFTRFFGVIRSMSESHATGGMLPKFSLDMIVSHIIEFDSSGTILSNDYISLGGNVDYESKYLQ